MRAGWDGEGSRRGAYARSGSDASATGVWSMQAKEVPPASHALVVWPLDESAGSVAPLASQCRAGPRKDATLPAHEHDGLQQSQ
jgi:hypothetical protein